MKASEILQLINAGYTKAEIDAMENPETDVQVSNMEPETTPAAEPETPPDPKPTPETPQTVNPQIEALTQQINSLVSAIQRSNLLNSQQPQQPRESAEDILANIIQPTHKKPDK